MNKKKLRFGVICSSNQNRSMEAHNVLQKKGFQVRSFGSGNQVKKKIIEWKNGFVSMNYCNLMFKILVIKNK